MKKTLIALAALAAGSAFAQSTVTLSGGVAAGYLHDASQTVNGAASTNSLNRFGAADNNITFTAIEDLGSGLKAGAVVQARFDPTDGRNRSTAVLPAGGSPFAQNVRLYVEGGFGKIMMGRFNAPVDDARAPLDVFNGADYTYWAPDDAPTRYNGMVSYTTPVFSGFKAVIATSLKANTTGATVNMTDVAATYANGPLYAMLAYTKNAGATPSAASATQVAGVTTSNIGVAVDGKNVTTVGASYDFGVAKPTLTYVKVNADTGSLSVSSKRWNLGVSAPIGTNVVLKASYENFDIDAASGDWKRTTLGADYLLSKRTKLIADVFKRNIDNGTSVFLGMKTTF